jgi:signal transduction histidine kinase
MITMKQNDFVRLAVLTVGIAILFLAGAFLYLRLTSPFDSARLVPGEWADKSDGLEVAPLLNLAGGLEHNDLVVAIDGQPIDRVAQSLVQPLGLRPDWRFGQTVIYTVLRHQRHVEIPITLGRYPLEALIALNWGNWLFILAYEILAVIIFIRRSYDRVVQVLFLWISCLVGSIIFWTLSVHASDFITGTGFWVQWLSQHILYVLFCSSVLHFTLVFPTQHRSVLQYRWLAPAVYVLPPVVYVLSGVVARLGSSGILEWIGRWVKAVDLLTSLILGLTLLALISGYKRVRQNPARQRVKLVVWTIAGCGTILLFVTLYHLFVNSPLYSEPWIGFLLLLGLPIPLALVIAIARYRLFRIRIILSRTLIYTALTISIIGIYVVVIGVLGFLFRTSDNLLFSLLATGLIAVIVQPLRERLQRGINQLIYGERDDPYGVMFRLGNRLEGALALDAALPIVVETVSESLRLPYAAIALKQGDSFVIAVAHGTSREHVVRLPIQYHGELVGQLILAPRTPGEDFMPADFRLLGQLAQQAGLVAHTVRLAADLQHSREHLVTAREEERRRLRRDLHDGLGPALATMILKLDTARDLLTPGSGPEVMLHELKTQVQTAIGDIRRLVYELRPPALDELGLVPALRAYAAQYNQNGLAIAIEASDELPVLPAAQEVAVYRITLEALTNVARHAGATACHVRLMLNEALCLEITDDGCGLPAERRIGVGLNSMRERAAELGGDFLIEPAATGGTRVLVRLPLVEN